MCPRPVSYSTSLSHAELKITQRRFTWLDSTALHNTELKGYVIAAITECQPYVNQKKREDGTFPLSISRTHLHRTSPHGT